MAMIRCPECKKEISDKASKCPSCGYPIGRIEAANNRFNKEMKKNIKMVKPILIVCVSILLVFTVGFGIYSIISSNLSVAIVGMWQTNDTYNTMYVFDKDSSYALYKDDEFRLGTFDEGSVHYNYHNNKPFEYGTYRITNYDNSTTLWLVPDGIEQTDYDNQKTFHDLKRKGGIITDKFGKLTLYRLEMIE